METWFSPNCSVSVTARLNLVLSRPTRTENLRPDEVFPVTSRAGHGDVGAGATSLVAGDIGPGATGYVGAEPEESQ